MNPANAVETKILVTGAGGFVGAALTSRLGPCRRVSLAGQGWREAIAVEDFAGATVIHLAARVHGRRGLAAEFEHDNVEKTRVLAQAAAAAGAARLVLASTVKVHGEETPEEAFRADSPPAPADAYARSKWRAEEALREVAARSGLPWVVVRFPLAYGPGVGGSFRVLLEASRSGIPLPFAAIRNRRSLVHVQDLAEALLLAATHSRACGQAFIAAHPEAVSTPGLVTAVREALGQPPRLFPVPARALEALATVAGLRDAMQRLTRSLVVDPTPLVSLLGWRPRISLAEGLKETVADLVRGRAR